MTRKKDILISVIVSLIVAAGWQLTTLSTHTSPANAASILQGTDGDTTTTWEYEFLVYPSYALSRKTLSYAGPIDMYTPPNLEDEINKLVQQGWFLERFTTVSSPDCSGYGISPSWQVIALLKRATK
jgi:hypothetical protein